MNFEGYGSVHSHTLRLHAIVAHQNFLKLCFIIIRQLEWFFNFCPILYLTHLWMCYMVHLESIALPFGACSVRSNWLQCRNIVCHLILIANYKITICCSPIDYYSVLSFSFYLLPLTLLVLAGDCALIYFKLFIKPNELD